MTLEMHNFVLTKFEDIQIIEQYQIWYFKLPILVLYYTMFGTVNFLIFLVNPLVLQGMIIGIQEDT